MTSYVQPCININTRIKRIELGPDENDLFYEKKYKFQVFLSQQYRYIYLFLDTEQIEKVIGCKIIL